MPPRSRASFGSDRLGSDREVGAHAFFIAQFEGFRAAANIVYGYGFELIQKNLAGGFDDRRDHLPHKPAVRRLVRIPMSFTRHSA